MPKLEHRNIEKVANRCGGRAVISGTRIRVSVIATCRQLGMSDQEIIRQYPHLTADEIHDALAYSADHPEEIEADLADDLKVDSQGDLLPPGS